jgi:hypothetical protein
MHVVFTVVFGRLLRRCVAHLRDPLPHRLLIMPVVARDAAHTRQCGLAPEPVADVSTFVLSPPTNSSRSTLGSARSSYHTVHACEADIQDQTIPLVAKFEPQPPPWHDFSDTAGELFSAADVDVEEIAQQYLSEPVNPGTHPTSDLLTSRDG